MRAEIMVNVTPDEAGEGYEVLRCFAAESHLAMLWSNEVEHRFKQGGELEKLMQRVLGAANLWYAQAASKSEAGDALCDDSNYIDEKMCLTLFAAMNVEPPSPNTSPSSDGWTHTDL